MKKTITEMSIEELQLAREVAIIRKNEFVKVQNFQSAITYRDKEVRIMCEIERRIDDMYDI